MEKGTEIHRYKTATPSCILKIRNSKVVLVAGSGCEGGATYGGVLVGGCSCCYDGRDGGST